MAVLGSSTNIMSRPFQKVKVSRGVNNLDNTSQGKSMKKKFELLKTDLVAATERVIDYCCEWKFTNELLKEDLTLLQRQPWKNDFTGLSVENDFLFFASKRVAMEYLNDNDAPHPVFLKELRKYNANLYDLLLPLYTKDGQYEFKSDQVYNKMKAE